MSNQVLSDLTQIRKGGIRMMTRYWVVDGVVYTTRRAAQEVKTSEAEKKTKK